MFNKLNAKTVGLAALLFVLVFGMALPANAGGRDRRDKRHHPKTRHVPTRRIDRHHRYPVVTSRTIKVWVPGYYTMQQQQVLVEDAHVEIRTIPEKVHIYRDEKGVEHRIVLSPAREERVWVPARYEMRQVRVWVPGHYEYRRTSCSTSSPARQIARGLSLIFKF